RHLPTVLSQPPCRIGGNDIWPAGQPDCEDRRRCDELGVPIYRQVPKCRRAKCERAPGVRARIAARGLLFGKGMVLRITSEERQTELFLKLEGHLRGTWVGELRLLWNSIRAGAKQSAL